MYDVIIIGNGPAGVSASIYTKRANLKTLVIGKDGGALEKAEKIDNFYGFPNGISGKALIDLGIEQIRNLEIDFIKEEVTAIDYENNQFTVVTRNMDYNSKTVIIATGVNRPKSKVDGLKDFEGKGVSYCAICDAFFFRGKDVAVLGNGDYAIHEITELLPIVKTVNVLTNGKERINLRDERIKVYDKPIKRFSGHDRLENIEFEDDTKLPVSAVFMAEGTASSVDFARRIGAVVDKNKIVVDEEFMTNIPGLFAAGDCIGGLLQVSKAVSDGAKAGIAVINYVRNNK